jgi:hypothetical protein
MRKGEIMKKDNKQSSSLALVKYICDKAIEGIPPLCSCVNLAQEYIIDNSYGDSDARVDSLINWETAKNFTSGFITGLGGLITLPVSIPSALVASWILQARLSGAIACIYGHKIHEDRVRTLILLSLLADAAKEPIKQAGIQIGRKLSEKALEKIPGRVLIEINKRVGFRLLTKAGEKGIIQLTKIIPVVGGFVGGSVDAFVCRKVGYTAKRIFKSKDEEAGGVYSRRGPNPGTPTLLAKTPLA